MFGDWFGAVGLSDWGGIECAVVGGWEAEQRSFLTGSDTNRGLDGWEWAVAVVVVGSDGQTPPAQCHEHQKSVRGAVGPGERTLGLHSEAAVGIESVGLIGCLVVVVVVVVGGDDCWGLVTVLSSSLGAWCVIWTLLRRNRVGLSSSEATIGV